MKVVGSDLSIAGSCLGEIRVGPFFTDDGPGWAIVKLEDGSRKIVDVPRSGAWAIRFDPGFVAGVRPIEPGDA